MHSTLWLLLPLPKHVLLLGDDVMETAGALLVTLFCFWGGWKPNGEGRPRRIALFCGLGLLCYAFQQFCIIWPDFAHRHAPVSRLTVDIISLASYPFLLFGIWRLPRRPLSLSSHLRISLDGLMIITAALTFSWYFLMGPAVLEGHQSLEGKVVSVAYLPGPDPLHDRLRHAQRARHGGGRQRPLHAPPFRGCPAHSLRLADQMRLDAATRRTLQVAALLHPMMGAVIVRAVPSFGYTLDVVRHHHERWDGKGYPFGLRGEETPFLARLVAVADAFSAMTMDRPYRKGMDREKALSVLETGAGTQRDPKRVRALLHCYRSAEGSSAEDRREPMARAA